MASSAADAAQSRAMLVGNRTAHVARTDVARHDAAATPPVPELPVPRPRGRQPGVTLTQRPQGPRRISRRGRGLIEIALS